MRKIKDNILNAITYIASGISVLILGILLVYLLVNGIKSINLEMFTNDYWAKNYLVEVNNEGTHSDVNYKGDDYYVEKYDIALKDKDKEIVVTYIGENSQFNELKSITAGNSLGMVMPFDVGYKIESFEYLDSNNDIAIGGVLLKQNASEVAQILNNQKINSIYYQSTSGGIKASIINTLILIFISLLIATPISIGSAIYLNEYNSKSKFNQLLSVSIETLAGVPSIIYGLVGITVLFPVTQLLGATTTSVLLGALTMAVILLPTMIKATQVALAQVDQGLKDASLSLGATKVQTINKVVLPGAFNGILSGLLLCVSKVIGESAALVYTMGTFISDTPSLTNQGTSLSLMIYSIMSNDNPNFELACAISLIILVIVLVLNISVKIINYRFNKIGQR